MPHVIHGPNFQLLLLTVEQVRLGPGGNKSFKPGRPKLFVTDGRDAALHGLCLIFCRVNPEKPITEANVSQVW